MEYPDEFIFVCECRISAVVKICSPVMKVFCVFYDRPAAFNTHNISMNNILMSLYILIKDYHSELDLDKLGLTIRAFISFRGERMKHPELIKLVEGIPEVIEWHTITGNYGVLLKVIAQTSEQLALVIERLEEFGETNTS